MNRLFRYMPALLLVGLSLAYAGETRDWWQYWPYAKEAEKCSSDKGYRKRNKGEVSCIHDRDGYRCFFGFDLRTGNSISGATC
ncbi:hypothetical protein GCM10027277_51490 [Pseudoduganella ginsengisoli]